MTIEDATKVCGVILGFLDKASSSDFAEVAYQPDSARVHSKAIRIVLAAMAEAERERIELVKAESVIANLSAALRSVERERDSATSEIRKAEQTLGKALGFPWHKDDPKNFPDATEADGVCTGPYTPATLAELAAERIRELELERDRLIERWPTYQVDGRVYFDADAGCWKTQGRYECFESREAAVLAAAGIEDETEARP